MGRIKRILRLCRFEFFDKGEGRHRRLVLRSFGKGRRETQKEFRRLVLGEFFLAKGEENEKMNSTSFQGLENQETLESFWYNEEAEYIALTEAVNESLWLEGIAKELKI